MARRASPDRSHSTAAAHWVALGSLGQDLGGFLPFCWFPPRQLVSPSSQSLLALQADHDGKRAVALEMNDTVCMCDREGRQEDNEVNRFANGMEMEVGHWRRESPSRQILAPDLPSP